LARCGSEPVTLRFDRDIEDRGTGVHDVRDLLGLNINQVNGAGLVLRVTRDDVTAVGTEGQPVLRSEAHAVKGSAQQRAIRKIQYVNGLCDHAAIGRRKLQATEVT
jgi:hypothetical protein